MMPLLAAIKAWALWQRLAGFWRWLFADLWRLAFALALAVAGIQTLRIEGLVIRPHAGPFRFTLIDWPGLARQLADARATIADRDRQIADMLAAERRARDDQIAANHQPAAASAAIAKASNHDAQAYYDAGRRAGAAYAAAHPVSLRPIAAPACGGERSAADLPRADYPAALNDRPGDPAAGVAIPRADYDQLVANSLRLAKVHQDAKALIEAGVAVEASASTE